MNERPVVREDGKIDFDGRRYAIGEGAAQFGLPGWPLVITIERVSPRRELITYGGSDGDLLPTGKPYMRCVGRLDEMSTLGVLGAPQTASRRVALTFFPINPSDLTHGGDWAARAARSWPLNAIWNSNPALDEPPIHVVAHIPADLMHEVALQAAGGRMEIFSLEIRLEKVFVRDRVRHESIGGEAAWLPPFEDNNRQPGPNMGYISSFWFRERDVILPDPEADMLPEPPPEPAFLSPAPIPAQAIPTEILAALAKLSRGVTILAILCVVLIVIALAK